MNDLKRRAVVTSTFLMGCLIALALAGCSEDPTESNSLTSSLPLSDFIIRDTTIRANASSTFRHYVAMDGRINMLGQQGGYTAYTALEFYPTYFPIRDTILVLSARLKLYTISRFGDSIGTFNFNAYSINRSWSETTLQWDSVQTGFYDATTSRGSYTGFAAPDTQQIVINLDTAMVRGWLTTAGNTSNYGIMLVPSPGSTLIRGLHEFLHLYETSYDSTYYYPTLEIIASGPSGTQDTANYNQGIDTFIGNIDNLNTNPSLIYVQAGVVYRAMLNFDASFIPKGSIINSAELQLTRDPATSRLGRFSADSSVAANFLISATDFTLYDGTTATGLRKAGTPYTYSFDTRHAVQSWVREANYGILIQTGVANQYSSLDLVTFFNEQADAAHSPRIRIIYSVRKD